MFKKATTALILSAVIMAGSSVSAFAEAPVQTVVVEQEYVEVVGEVCIPEGVLVVEE